MLRGMDRARQRTGEGLTAIHVQSKLSERAGRRVTGLTVAGFGNKPGNDPRRPSRHGSQGSVAAWLREPDAPPDGEDNMRQHSTSFTTPGHAGSTSLWNLIAAYMAGLVLLCLIAPTEARAQTAADSTAVLRWTAPGDDGTAGRATSYALRYRNAAITGTDTLGWWNAATQATGLPVPGVSGSTDSVRVRGL